MLHHKSLSEQNICTKFITPALAAASWDIQKQVREEWSFADGRIIVRGQKDPQLNDRMEEWQFHYNWFQPHGSLRGKSPIDIVTEKSALTPLWEDVGAKYDPSKEPIREQHYGRDKSVKMYRKKRRAAET